MAATAAAKNRKIRQEALREQLAGQGHVQHIVDIAKKLREQAQGLEPTEINALKAAADIHAKMINKYLPDIKAIELTGDGGDELGLESLTDEVLNERIKRLAVEAGIIDASD